MQYREFLKLAGVTEQDVPFWRYRRIESLYMSRDDLFPTKAEVVEYFHRFGLFGFSSGFLLRLDALRAAVTSAKRYAVFDGMFEQMLDLALDSSGRG